MSTDPARPNLLLIMTDQQRGDCLSCDGHPVIETPNLDQLAAQGVRFRHAYSAVPSCIPTRASLLTGMNQWHTGILGMGYQQGAMADRYAHTLPGELAAAGYHTQGIGKMHFHPQRALNGFHNTLIDESSRVGSPEFVSDYRAWFAEHKDGSYGYQDHAVDWNSWMARPTHLPEHLHPTHWTAEQSVRWLARRDPHKPFFLKMSFARPHSPYDPPQVYYDMYRDAAIPPPVIGDWAPVPPPHERNKIDAWWANRTAVEIRRARACYFGSITFIDHQIGRFLGEMRRNIKKELQNTLIIFVSDHGDMQGDHYLWRKTYAYEGSARVPFIVKLPDTWRDAVRGQVRDEVVELRDIMPTFLEAVGIPIPNTVDGQSLLPLARGQTVNWRPFLHGEHCMGSIEADAMQYLTDGREKYIWIPYLNEDQFFDLQSDPTESRNLAAVPEHAHRVNIWRQRMVDEMQHRQWPVVRDGKLQRATREMALVSPHYMHYGMMPQLRINAFNGMIAATWQLIRGKILALRLHR